MGAWPFLCIRKRYLQLASRHHSLDLSEVKDVTDLLIAFENVNSVVISMELRAVSGEAGPDTVVAAFAWSRKADDTEAMLLASVSVRCSATNLRHFRAVVTHVLYLLDFRLALNEFDSAEKKKA